MEYSRRKPTRLRCYNYSNPGGYFVTICTKGKKKLFGEVVGGGALDAPQMVLSEIGRVAEQELLSIENYYENVTIDKYVVMPNHIHLLIRITERINPFPTKQYDIPNVVGKYKAAVTRHVGNAFMHSVKLWQTSYHDHIIRNEADYRRIWEYIDTNPVKWKEDCFYVAEE
ncbi:MAG: transposase [Clostridia bacterium]|nr:transposase [Clostridia bacterium]